MILWHKLLVTLLALSAYGGLCWHSWRQYRRHNPAVSVGAGELLVAYASQSGTAQALAEQVCGALAPGARAQPLSQLADGSLAAAKRAVFVVSTYGDGEAPDNGQRFERRWLKGQPPRLDHLQIAVLALGDSSYPDYCAFGRRLELGLQALGAGLWQPRLELDAALTGGQQAVDSAVVHKWLQTLAGAGVAMPVLRAVGSSAPETRWTLIAREHLNSQSESPGLFRLRFAPDESSALAWRAGDIAELWPRNSAAQCRQFLDALAERGVLDDEGAQLIPELQSRQLPAVASLNIDVAESICQNSDCYSPQAPCIEGKPVSDWVLSLPRLGKREYSIASIPETGHLDIVLRQRQDKDGRLGLASGWLCNALVLGESVELRVRNNRQFHLAHGKSPLILIGSGSGLAGLWSHLLDRRRQGQRENWLIFGERHPEHDAVYRDDIMELQRAGFLPKLDRVFSQCPSRPAYVQAVLSAEAETLKSWVAEGASILVCGSRQGMGAAVDETLRALLGNGVVDLLGMHGRYLRDVY
ncbi:flavodoxin domain-containing protein [Spongiibacter taiwanensis]|uniref:flavodoxin domain-containing protein n=1 Tax=Spongiibacter taiwanensis TaxID=1748242 RepID=UPI002034AC0A|nr:flavodoxin domain-containing protein [Spongiibacter taiwanensis]USA44542.1 flavodoxin domain-containing protein [Spongiibacter taiwanensis]